MSNSLWSFLEILLRPLLHPTLVNGRSGDPALYVETLFERHAILFDLGDISSLSPRDIQRIEHVFVTHAHIDHFYGFDRLLRLLIGRDKKIDLYGPSGFIENVSRKIHAYHWNLIDRYLSDFIITVTEIDTALRFRTARLRLKKAFAVEPIANGNLVDGVVCKHPTFQVTTAVLDHHMQCLGFAIVEPVHLNIWKSRLTALGLPVGSWLRDFKQAVLCNAPQDYVIQIRARPTSAVLQETTIRDLADILTVTPGQKIGYITDVADTAANRAAIIGLVKGADVLFIESTFAAADTVLATERAHLTTTAAGTIAREAHVRRVEPFHFSTRYAGREDQMFKEVLAAFSGSKQLAD